MDDDLLSLIPEISIETRNLVCGGLFAPWDAVHKCPWSNHTPGTCPCRRCRRAQECTRGAQFRGSAQ